MFVLRHLDHLVERYVERFLAVHLEGHGSALEDGAAPVPALGREFRPLHVYAVVLLDEVVELREGFYVPLTREAKRLPAGLLHAGEL